jgi:hypothetical protein
MYVSYSTSWLLLLPHEIRHIECGSIGGSIGGSIVLCPVERCRIQNIFGSNDADGLALGALELGDRDRADDGHPLVAVAV